MFKVNDYIMSSSSGVCQITAIQKDEYNNIETEYYVLHPVHSNNMVIRIPVDSAPRSMRPLLTKDEAISLIATMPGSDSMLIDDSKKRSTVFKAAIKTRNNEELIKVITTLHLEREAKTAANKKLSKTDEDILSIAEKQVCEEFALALDISPNEVVPYILDYLATH